MSTKYSGVNYANTQASPYEAVEESQYNVVEKHILDQFVLTADLAAGDQILVGGPIPAGAVLLDAVLTSAAMGGSAAVNFGWLASADGSVAADATAFFAALPVSSATVAKAHGSTFEGDFYTQVPLAAAVQPVIACSVATSGATGHKLSVDIKYVKCGG